jgi:hypothetical protein
MRSQVQVLAGPPLFSQLRALQPSSRSRLLPAWAAVGPRTAAFLTGDPRAQPAHPGRPGGRGWPLPEHSHDDGQVQADASTGPARPAPASSARLRRGQTTSRSWTPRGDHADSGRPRRVAAHRTAARYELPVRTQRTRECTDTGRPHRTPDTGHRTPDTGHPDTWTLRRPHRTLDTGRVDIARVDTGRSHRTLAEDADRVTKARPASGYPGPPRRAAARWNAEPYSCGRCRRRSAPMQARR